MSFNAHLDIGVAIASLAMSLVAPATAIAAHNKATKLHHLHYTRPGAAYRPRLFAEDRKAAALRVQRRRVPHWGIADSGVSQSMIRKTAQRFSEKIVLNQRPKSR